MLKFITVPIRKFLNKKGYEIVKLHDLGNPFLISTWMEKLDINTVIDVGSNEGQFINAINQVIPGRKIFAFEPIKVCYDKLLANTKGLNITAYNCGLSDRNGSSEINISENFVSSSILPMENLHKNLYPDSKYIKTQSIDIKRLDDVIKEADIQKNALLKIDVQGYEEKVILGGANTIKNVAAVIVEFAYEPVYEGQWLFDDTYKYFTSNGFKFAGFADQTISKNTGIPVYGDAIFIRKELMKQAY